MDTKQLGLVIAGIGVVGVFYEYFSSSCLRRLPEVCYFHFSPGEVVHGLPFYSAIVLIIGLLLVLGAQEGE